MVLSVVKDKGKVLWRRKHQPACRTHDVESAYNENHELTVQGAQVTNGTLSGRGLAATFPTCSCPTFPAPAHLAGSANQYQRGEGSEARRPGYGQQRQHHRQPQGPKRADQVYDEAAKDEDEGDKMIDEIQNTEEDIADFVANL